MYFGKVAWFHAQKGFGFIKRDDKEPDVFVHFTSVMADGYRTLNEGDRVSFDITSDTRGQSATSVFVINEG